MSLSNRITLEQFRHMPVGKVAALPAEELLLLQEDVERTPCVPPRPPGTGSMAPWP